MNPYYTIIPNSLLEADIEATDISVYLVIAMHWNEQKQDSWPSITTIAKRAKVSKATAVRAIKRLEAAGAIKAERKDGVSTHYFITYDRTQIGNGEDLDRTQIRNGEDTNRTQIENGIGGDRTQIGNATVLKSVTPPYSNEESNKNNITKSIELDSSSDDKLDYSKPFSVYEKLTQRMVTTVDEKWIRTAIAIPTVSKEHVSGAMVEANLEGATANELCRKANGILRHRLRKGDVDSLLPPKPDVNLTVSTEEPYADVWRRFKKKWAEEGGKVA